MSAVPKKQKLTEAEYLTIERSASFKSEFYQGEMFAMAGARYAHNRIKENLSGMLYAALSKGPCQSLSSDMRLKVEATGFLCYPDLMILCDPPMFIDEVEDTLSNPVVLIEVLSESTEKFDRGKKFDHYKRIPTLKEYLLVSQDEIRIERYHRLEDGNWAHGVFTETDAEMTLASLPVRLPIADLYAGVSLEPSEP